jgi:LPS sulfotransferase NodH
MVRGMLDHHPEIRCAGELLNGDKQFAAPTRNRGLSYLWPKCGTTIVGFVVHLHECFETTSGKQLINYIKKHPEIRVIRLFRRNKAKAFVSLQIAQQTGCWNTHEERATTETVIFDLARFDAFCFDIDQQDRRLRYANLPNARFELEYEELCGKPVEIACRLQEFLGCMTDKRTLHPNTKKQEHRSLTQVIENYEEVADELRKRRCNVL